jgi:glutamate 5-kinase
MATKIEAARIASLAGVATVIAPGRPAATLAGVLRGEAIGTCVSPAGARHGGRRRWIALGATPAGAFVVDEGAARAVAERGASLLASGVVAVEGRFFAGDVVAVRDGGGRELARGLTNLSADEARLVIGRSSAEIAGILGRQSFDELIHRDNLVLSTGA